MPVVAAANAGYSAVIDNGVEFVGRGGGIGNYGSMSLENATVAGNYAGTFGAGVFNERSNSQINHATHETVLRLTFGP